MTRGDIVSGWVWGTIGFLLYLFSFVILAELFTWL